MFKKLFTRKLNSGEFKKRYQNHRKKPQSEGKFIVKEAKPLAKAIASILNSKSNTPARWYVKELNDTRGDYTRRDKMIVKNVNKVVGTVKKSIAHDRTLAETPYGLIIKIHQILHDRKNIQLFNRAYRDLNGVVDSSNPAIMFVSMYISLVYAMESLALVITTEYHNMVDINGRVSEDAIDRVLVSKHIPFIRNVALPAVDLVSFIEANDLTKEYGEINKQIDENKKNAAKISTEMVGSTFLASAALVAAVIWVSLSSIRYIIYWLKVIKIDISMFLREEVDFLEINVKEFEEKLANTTDEKERNRIEKIISKQQKEAERFEKIADQLYATQGQQEVEVVEQYESDERFSDNDSGINPVQLSL